MVCGIALVLIPLLIVLMFTGAVEMPAQGQVPPRSFSTALLLLVIVCLFAAVKFIMTFPVSSAEDAGPLTILKRSWNLTRGHYWPLFGVDAAVAGRGGGAAAVRAVRRRGDRRGDWARSSRSASRR